MGVVLYTTTQIKVLGVTQLLKFFTHRQFANEDRRPRTLLLECLLCGINWSKHLLPTDTCSLTIPMNQLPIDMLLIMLISTE